MARKDFKTRWAAAKLTASLELEKEWWFIPDVQRLDPDRLQRVYPTLRRYGVKALTAIIQKAVRILAAIDAEQWIRIGLIRIEPIGMGKTVMLTSRAHRQP